MGFKRDQGKGGGIKVRIQMADWVTDGVRVPAEVRKG